MKKLLAFISQKICPVCIFCRRFPDSKFSKATKAIRESCPCCRAYEELKRE